VAEHITIRWAVIEDDGALLALDRAAFSAESGFPSFAGRETFFTERSRPEEVLVAEHDGRVAGYLKLVPRYPFAEGAGVFGVHGLAVAPDSQRLGIASALLDEAEAEARRRGGRKLVLNVFGTNTGAQRLYERQGFVVEGRGRAEFLIEGRLVDDLSLAKFLQR
jgi:ribosomal protein S18 acetylase RimI-like enzyme